MSPKLRTFVGLALPASVRHLLLAASRSLQGHLPPDSVRWVAEANQHLTLFFLGQTPAEKLPEIKRTLDAIGAEFKPFSLTTGELGCFPSPRRPRVFWVGLDDKAGSCAQLHGRLQSALVPLGWTPEKRPYIPHLTLAYARREVRLPRLQAAISVSSQSWSVSEFTLFQSVTRAEGPVYTPLHTVAF